MLTDSSVYRNHAYDDYGIGDTGIVGSGRTLSGGVEKFLRVPSAFSLDDLHEKSFTFSTWIKLDEAPPSKAEDSVYASGYLTNPNDTYFDDINNFYTLTPSGSRIMQTGPRQGLYFDGDNDFKNGGLVLTEMIIISLSFKLFSLPRKVVTTFSDVTARMIMPRSGWILIGMVLLRKMEISAVRN